MEDGEQRGSVAWNGHAMLTDAMDDEDPPDSFSMRTILERVQNVLCSYMYHHSRPPLILPPGWPSRKLQRAIDAIRKTWQYTHCQTTLSHVISQDHVAVLSECISTIVTHLEDDNDDVFASYATQAKQAAPDVIIAVYRTPCSSMYRCMYLSTRAHHAVFMSMREGDDSDVSVIHHCKTVLDTARVYGTIHDPECNSPLDRWGRALLHNVQFVLSVWRALLLKRTSSPIEHVYGRRVTDMDVMEALSANAAPYTHSVLMDEEPSRAGSDVGDGRVWITDFITTVTLTKMNNEQAMGYLGHRLCDASYERICDAMAALHAHEAKINSVADFAFYSGDALPLIKSPCELNDLLLFFQAVAMQPSTEYGITLPEELTFQWDNAQRYMHEALRRLVYFESAVVECLGAPNNRLAPRNVTVTHAANCYHAWIPGVSSTREAQRKEQRVRTLSACISEFHELRPWTFSYEFTSQCSGSPTPPSSPKAERPSSSPEPRACDGRDASAESMRARIARLEEEYVNDVIFSCDIPSDITEYSTDASPLCAIGFVRTPLCTPPPSPPSSLRPEGEAAPVERPVPFTEEESLMLEDSGLGSAEPPPTSKPPKKKKQRKKTADPRKTAPPVHRDARPKARSSIGSDITTTTTTSSAKGHTSTPTKSGGPRKRPREPSAAAGQTTSVPRPKKRKVVKKKRTEPEPEPEPQHTEEGGHCTASETAEWEEAQEVVEQAEEQRDESETEIEIEDMSALYSMYMDDDDV